MPLSESTLGKLIEGDAERDAIHVAILPAVAGMKLAPGQDVGFMDDSRELVGTAPRTFGIIDPFLKSMVFPQQKVWVLLYPNTITSLRHNWTHPGIDEPLLSVGYAREWLESFASSAGLDYVQLSDIVEKYVATGEPWVESESERARNAYDRCDKETFWKCMNLLYGLSKPSEESGAWYSPFSCSC